MSKDEWKLANIKPIEIEQETKVVETPSLVCQRHWKAILLNYAYSGTTFAIEENLDVVKEDPIDRGILEVVKGLNKRGFKTVYSCSSLDDDHLRQVDRDRSLEPYIKVKGKHPELINIAEASGWNWEFSGHAFTDGKPVDIISFRGTADGQIFKEMHPTLDKPVIDEDGDTYFWEMGSEKPSSKEEAIQSKVLSTQLRLDKGDDKFKKHGIARLLKVLTQKSTEAV